MKRLLQLTAASLALVACASEPAELGLDEPLRVSGAVFKSGKLPGAAPDDTAPEGQLMLTTIETNNTVVHPGQVGKRISGRAKDAGYSVAVKLDGLGSGYWVKPLDEADSVYPGELAFRLDLELAHNLPLGIKNLLFTVIDSSGRRAGRQQKLQLCSTNRYDRALNACDATQKPPAAIISLSWDTSADLDLVVRTPDGELVDARHPSTLTDPALEGDQDLDYQGVLYTEDARRCGGQSGQHEDLVWANEIPSGRYDVFVNLFDFCNVPATFFRVRAFVREELDDGTFDLIQIADAEVGQLLEDEANGGSATPRKIASYDLP
jgi:hypothetical protein